MNHNNLLFYAQILPPGLTLPTPDLKAACSGLVLWGELLSWSFYETFQNRCSSVFCLSCEKGDSTRSSWGSDFLGVLDKTPPYFNTLFFLAPTSHSQPVSGATERKQHLLFALEAHYGVCLCETRRNQLDMCAFYREPVAGRVLAFGFHHDAAGSMVFANTGRCHWNLKAIPLVK